MPRFDGTGPFAQGPMTGRGMGPCAFGFGLRRGWGKMSHGVGRGSGFWGWVQPQTQKGQLEALKDYKKFLEEELQDADEEIKKMEK